ncbi:galactose mutarotase-like [Octopus sinensis]|uniref:Galactose mutarotase n=1 Tax=Octopus sinensis TaxID=2607531 RepID=A0A6P7TYX1_9MOLL|nr:galactose mutarotase-like [Octopus sinensis]
MNIPDGHLHGGIVGFNKKCWNFFETENNSIEFNLCSPEGDEGYPGSLNVSVKYSLEDVSVNDSEIKSFLKILFVAKSSLPTIVNLTNHTYFNLGGNTSGSINDHLFQFPGAFYTPLDSNMLPTGQMLKNCF